MLSKDTLREKREPKCKLLGTIDTNGTLFSKRVPLPDRVTITCINCNNIASVIQQHDK